MNELISQLWTPELTAGFIVVIVLLLVLYVLSIVWVVRDAYMRGTQWYIWAIVALVPGIGVIAYLLLRPPLLQIDRDEQELEIALKQRELMRYGECATCGYPVEADYVLCPNCLTQLKNLCRTCHKALDPTWEVCPYCATPVMVVGHRPAPAAAPAPAESVIETSVHADVKVGKTQKANPRNRARKAEPVETVVEVDEVAVQTATADANDGVETAPAPAESPKSKRPKLRPSLARVKNKRGANRDAKPATEEAAQTSPSEQPEQKNNPRNAKKTATPTSV